MNNQLVKNLMRLGENSLKTVFYNSVGSVVYEQVNDVKQIVDNKVEEVSKKLIFGTLSAVIFFWTSGVFVVTLYLYVSDLRDYAQNGLYTGIVLLIILLIVIVIGKGKEYK